MNQQTMITICEARASQSGKSLGIKDQNGTWYTTKHWDLQALVGQAIYAETSVSEFNGKQMHWINDYNRPDGTSQGAPAPQVQSNMPPPMPTQGPPAHKISTINKDASITAMALCKCIRTDDPGTVWKAYKAFYKHYLDEMVNAGNQAQMVNVPVQPPAPVPASEEIQIQNAMDSMSQQEATPYDDGIPF